MSWRLSRQNFQFRRLTNKEFLNLIENLLLFVCESVKLIERVRVFCKSNKTNPSPNSMAESTKKKNVNDKILRLL